MPSIDWAKLEHAYGAAGDVPRLLEAARQAPAGGRYTDEPWYSLWSALCHQGDVFTASFAAVPELVDIAELRQAEHAAARECVLLAATIELERALPEGRFPPDIPAAIRPSYDDAMRRGAQVAAVLLAAERHPDYVRGLEGAIAAMRGDAAAARRLFDRDAET